MCLDGACALAGMSQARRALQHDSGSQGAHLWKRGAFLMASSSTIQVRPMVASIQRKWLARTMRLYTMSCMRSACGILYPTMYFTCHTHYAITPCPATTKIQLASLSQTARIIGMTIQHAKNLARAQHLWPSSDAPGGARSNQEQGSGMLQHWA